MRSHLASTVGRLSVAASAVAAVMTVAACGSSSPGSSGTSSGAGRPSSPAQVQQEQRDVVRFAQCMRLDGVSNLPDPTADPIAFKQALGQLSGSPAFKSATSACQHLLPGGGVASHPGAQTRAHTMALLAFARCLRGQGFPSFPDPTSNGQITHQILASAGIDIHQPALAQAADACTTVTHGAITRSMVARFVAGQ